MAQISWQYFEGNGNLIDTATILNTRPKQQSSELTSTLQKQGFNVIEFPWMEIVPIEDISPQQIAQHNSAEIIIFISQNAVSHYFSLFTLPQQAVCASIGKATAQAIINHSGQYPAIYPQQGNDSEALLNHPQLKNVANKNICIVRGLNGREKLANELKGRGANVHYLEIYYRKAPKLEIKEIEILCQRHYINTILAFSSESLQNFEQQADLTQKMVFHDIPLMTIHAKIADFARRLGYTKTNIAYPTDNKSIGSQVKHLLNQDKS